MSGACVGARRAPVSGNGVQQCDTTGSWTAPVPCANQACVGGACTGIVPPARFSAPAITSRPATGPASGRTRRSAVCSGTNCSGVCSPGQTQCSGNGVETCDSTNSWGASVACTSRPASAFSSRVPARRARYGAPKQRAELQLERCVADGDDVPLRLHQLVVQRDVLAPEPTVLRQHHPAVRRQARGRAPAPSALMFAPAGPARAFVPDAGSCGDQQPEICNGSGNYQPSGAPCDGERLRGQGVRGELRPGDHGVLERSTVTCQSNGTYGPPRPCTYVCNPGTGTCGGVCHPGATMCVGNQSGSGYDGGTGVETCDLDRQLGRGLHLRVQAILRYELHGGCDTKASCCSDVEICDDGIDNDCNGLSDCADPRCSSAGWSCTSLPSGGGWTIGAFDQTARPTCPANFGTTGKTAYTSVCPGRPDTCNCTCRNDLPLRGPMGLDALEHLDLPGGSDVGRQQRAAERLRLPEQPRRQPEPELLGGPARATRSRRSPARAARPSPRPRGRRATTSARRATSRRSVPGAGPASTARPRCPAASSCARPIPGSPTARPRPSTKYDLYPSYSTAASATTARAGRRQTSPAR